MPVYIGKRGDLVGCYRSLTHSQTTENRATQLLSSIKHKLSHAICRLGLPELAESVTALTYVNAKGDVRRLTNKHEVSFPLGVI